jgi:hypothetical protein
VEKGTGGGKKKKSICLDPVRNLPSANTDMSPFAALTATAEKTIDILLFGFFLVSRSVCFGQAPARLISVK